jgi:hypothetical protein
MGENGVMGGGGMSPADFAALMNRNYGNDMWGNNNALWIVFLFALFCGGNGFGFGNNGFQNAIGYENLATSNEVQRGFDNQNLQAQTRDILAAVNSGTAQSVATTNQVYHDVVNSVQDKYSELARDIAAVQVGQANLLANQNECCCATKMLVQETAAQNRYDNAMNTASINATTTAQTQKILDAIQQNKIESLQNQVNQLELQSQLAGVVRYPMSTAYTSGGNPFCGCGCGGNI